MENYQKLEKVGEGKQAPPLQLQLQLPLPFPY